MPSPFQSPVLFLIIINHPLSLISAAHMHVSVDHLLGHGQSAIPKEEETLSLYQSVAKSTCGTCGALALLDALQIMKRLEPRQLGTPSLKTHRNLRPLRIILPQEAEED